MSLLDVIQIKIREKLNPYLGPHRRKKLHNSHFTIISNNCWAGHVYRYFSLPYSTPTVGLYFFSEDYIKFLENLKEYLNKDLEFIKINESRFCNILKERGGKNSTCPIGKLGDIEIIFLHYKTEEEALEKWNRRKSRIYWDNIYVKMAEQNNCSMAHMERFEMLTFEKKILFTSKDYGLPSQVIYKEYAEEGQVTNDTTHFRRYINIVEWLNK